MGKSDLLRAHDVRDAYRLIGECRDLGGDPALWHGRMCEGLRLILGARAVTGGEGWWRRPEHDITPVSAHEAGLDAAARERFRAFMREQGPSNEPTYRALQRLPGPLLTVTRAEVVTDAQWYRSVAYTDFRRPAGLDDAITSVCELSKTGAISAVHVHRGTRERRFSARERRLLNFFHGELGPLIGRALVSATESTPAQLSPRLRQALACLLEGDSEKQVAARLGLSQSTVHQYVTALYRRFGVQSRSQLLAHALRRVAGRRWSGIGSAPRPRV